jgi:hypothetical protein
MAKKTRPTPRVSRRTGEKADETVLAKELDERLTRLEAGIAEERRQMTELLAQLRTTRIAA